MRLIIRSQSGPSLGGEPGVRMTAMAAKHDLTALDLGRPARLEPDLAAYFEKCRDKLGFVPNVLQAYAFDNAKLKAFVMMADELMLGDSGLSKLEREMIALPSARSITATIA